jgi:hypothetical protein
VTHVRCETCAALDAGGILETNHCRDCHRSWRGHAEAHCAVCHRHFGGDVAFLAHRADGICRDPAQLKTKPSDGSLGKPRFRLIERKHSGTVLIQNDERVFAEV